MKRLLLLLLLLLTGAPFILAGSKLSPDLPKSNGPNLIDVIVRFKNNAQKAADKGNNGNQNNGNQNNGNQNNGNHNGWNNNQNDNFDGDAQQVGQSGQIQNKWQTFNAVHVKLPAAAVQALANNPSVQYVTPNRPLKGALDITDQTVNANLAWSFGWTGTGVGVALVDSGITVRTDLMTANKMTSRVVYSQSFVSTETTTNDLYGHGTHVAGIIGSDGANSIGINFTRTFKGVAPNVNLINLKALDRNGVGQESDVIAAIQAAIQLKNTYNIRVLNISLGRPVFESYTLDPLCQAVEAAWQAGIVVVVAAGNSGRDNSLGTHGYGTINSPGNDPYVITVGATNTKGTPQIWDDTVASYSSKGPTLVDHIVKPDLVAPGNGIVSLLASPSATLYLTSNTTHVNDPYYEIGVPGTSADYLRLSGTSMATPVVAGAAALMIQKNPGITPDTVKARLMKSAAKLLPRFQGATDAITGAFFSGQGDIFSVGAGYLDVNAALASTDSPTLPAMSPIVSFNTVNHHVALIRDFSVCWGDSIVWGDDPTFGIALFSGTSNGLSVVWGDSVTWGDLNDPGFGVIWSPMAVNTSSITATSDDDSDQ